MRMNAALRRPRGAHRAESHTGRNVALSTIIVLIGALGAVVFHLAVSGSTDKSRTNASEGNLLPSPSLGAALGSFGGFSSPVVPISSGPNSSGSDIAGPDESGSVASSPLAESSLAVQPASLPPVVVGAQVAATTSPTASGSPTPSVPAIFPGLEVRNGTRSVGAAAVAAQMFKAAGWKVLDTADNQAGVVPKTIVYYPDGAQIAAIQFADRFVKIDQIVEQQSLAVGSPITVVLGTDWTS